MKTVLKKITPFISILFFGIAVWFLEHELRQHDLGEVTRQLSDIPLMHVLVSLFLSFMSYLVLTFYDGLGVRYIGEELSTNRIVRAGFISYAFSHNVGLALLTGGSMRYRLYSAWGFSGIQVTQIVAFGAFTLWLGFCTVAGFSLLFTTPELPRDLTIPFMPLQILGVILLVMTAGYLLGSARVDKITFKKWSFAFPDLGVAVQQVVLASVDWLMASSVLYVLLPEAGIGFFSFTGVFLLAQIIGLFSQVPGGLGVFESVMLVYLSNFMDGSTVLGILLVYRIIYYILPLIVAMIMLGYQEYIANRRVVREFGSKAVDWLPRVVPHILSVSVFFSGAMLLFTGAVPTDIPQLEWLRNFLSISVIEMSHFLASLVGAGLLVLAHGLQRRIDAAFHLTVGLMTTGVILSILRGADYIEASVLIILLGVLLPSRREFYREASLLSQRFSTSWISIILLVIFSSVLLGVFLYGTQYQNDLWWQFTLQGDAPRYLRASVAILACSLIFGLVQLLRPRPPVGGEPEESEMKLAERIARRSLYANSSLVLSGDKKLLFNEDYTSFIMYAVEGRSWISMGDPVGSAVGLEEIIWKFRNICDEYDAWPVFYQVREDNLGLYADLGLTQLKLGEEARVPLIKSDPKNSVDPLLISHQKALKEAGFGFEVVGKNEAEKYLPQLSLISDAWLQERGERDNRFSQGFFSPDYLRNFPLALVTHGDEIIAFSNIWSGTEHHELAADLIRFLPEKHEHLLDFLLMEIISWGRQQGYQWFNLGTAPLSGMGSHEFNPRWNKVADLVFTYGDNIYDFKKIREYKSRFNPVWEPRYLICPGGLAIPGVISSLTSLVSGGIKGLITR